MNDLKHWQSKIKEKRSNTSLNDFLMFFGSWYPVNLYKNNALISRYPPTKRTAKIIDPSTFETERSSYVGSGLNYDEQIDFFTQFRDLFLQTPLGSVVQFPEMNENSDYGDIIFGAKNSYLNIVAVGDIEDACYNFFVKNACKNIYSSFFILNNSENIYFSKFIDKSNNIFYSKYILNSYNVWFSTNMTGCKECLYCNDLVNSEFYIQNKKYNQQDYFIKKNELLRDTSKYMSTYKTLDNIGKNHGSTNVTGNCNLYCENLEKGFYCDRVKNGRNAFFIHSQNEICENMYDVFGAGNFSNNDFYGVSGAGMGSSHLYCCSEITESHNIFYSYHLRNCSFCFGCIGLSGESFCILNQQYSKEDWHKITDKIFEQMKQDNILGNFFPGEVNPFYLNDTMAGILGNFSKEEVTAKGYMWRDEEIKTDIPEGADIISSNPSASGSSLSKGSQECLDDYEGFDLNGNWKINPEVLKKVIVDEKGNYYRIVQLEYNFLVKHSLPLPRLHWLDRMKLNFGIK